MKKIERFATGWVRQTLAMVLILAVGCGDREHRSDLTVMTLNVYYGFDVGPLLSAGSAEEIPFLALEAFRQLNETNFFERADAMADKIALERPHLIGLQEVALIRLQSPGDAVAGGTEPAEQVVLDYLGILCSALAMRGLEYRVAAMIQNVDVELPMLTGMDPLTFDDIRLTDYDVILARGDVKTANAAAVRYQDRLVVPNLNLEIPRGYVAVDARVGDTALRFVNTHLEDTPFPEVQLAQVRELAAALASETKPVVLVGDLNSPAPDGGVVPFLASEGFEDAWTRNVRAGQGEGLTWGHDPGLTNPPGTFTMRLDLVLVKAGRGSRDRRPLLASAEVWGDETSERTVSGLWPSDHAAVVASLWLPWRGD